MVQGSNQTATTPVPLPRSNININPHADNGGPERNSDADRRERIQRYKEERRKQMAARYGTTADLSSSDEDNAADSSSNVARRRRRGKTGTESSSTEVSTTESRKTFQIKDRRVRKTSDDLSKGPKNLELAKSPLNNNSKEICDDSVYQVKRRVADDVPIENVVAESQEAGSSSGVSDSKVTRRRNSGSKDKSHKRKSNLNRAPSEEPTPEADDSIRRRRRRSDNILATVSPELTSVQLVASVSSSGSCQSVSAPRLSEGSSGGDLKPRKRLSYDGDTKTITSKGHDAKRVTSRHSLKKPEIPETLRSKEVRTHHKNIHAQERPPTGPELGKTTGVKSQRKSQDYGTCFMANKREKENAINSKGGLPIDRSANSTWESDQSNDAINDHIDNLTAQAKSLIARVENMSNVPENPTSPNESSLITAEECQFYNNSTSPLRKSKDSSLPGDHKNRLNGCEDLRSQKRAEVNTSKRLAFRESANTDGVPVAHMSAGFPMQSVSFEDDRRSRKDCMSNAELRAEHFSQKGSGGSSVDSESPRVNSPEPHSILKRKSSRGEQLAAFDRSTTPEPQSILKKKSTSRTSSSDNLDCEPRPILKKKNSTEELDHSDQKPKPILKKKSLTDDELELTYVLPRSILKGARSREDLPRTDGVISPAPILKRFSKSELDYEGDLKPILKRRQTTDGVRSGGNNSDSETENPYRLRSDSAPDAVALPNWSPLANRGVTPRHGILKNSRNNRSSTAEDSELSVLLRHRRPAADNTSSDSFRYDSTNRPVSPSLSLLTGRKNGSERPLSVAERIAGMEALQLPCFDGSASSNRGEASPTALSFQEASAADDESFLSNVASTLPVTDYSVDDDTSFGMASRVSQRAAFFAQLERNGTNETKQSEDSSRKGRGARFATQPVTDTEVNEASRMVDSPVTPTAERYGSLDNIQAQPLHVRVANDDFECESSVGARVALWSQRLHQIKMEASNPPRRSRAGRYRTQPVTLDEVSRAHAYKGHHQTHLGAAKNGFDKKEVPKSILKSDFIRRLSNEDHLKSILKNDSPLSSLVTSPEQEARPLRSVLKKDSSVDDSKEIKSILKRQSESLEPDDSSDSSSDNIKEPEKLSVPEVKSTKSRKPLMVTDNWAEALRNMGPTRATESKADKRPVDTRNPRSDEILHERTAFEEDALIFGESNPWELEGISRLRGINTVSIAEATNSQLICDKEISVDQSLSDKVVPHERNLSLRNTSYERKLSSDSESDQEDKIVVKDNVSMRNTIPQSFERWSLCDPQPRQDILSTSMPPPSNPILAMPTKRPNRGDMNASDILSKSPMFSSRFAEVSSSSSLISAEDSSKAFLKDGDITSSQRWEAISKETKTGGWGSKDQKGPDDSIDSDSTILRKARPTSLLDRVTQLETSSLQWKNRVEQSDATRFTVAHRMTSSSTSSVPNALLKGPPRSPSVERVRRIPQAKVFKSKTGGNIPDMLGSVRKELFARSQSQPSDSQERVTGAVVSVPNPDDADFNAFFSSSSTKKVDHFNTDIGSFDCVTRNSSQLLVNRRNVRVTRRQQSSSNPLRTLAQRQDLKSEYTEFKLGVGDRELKRMKVEEISKTSSFAMEALAGLASKENFNAISLKKVDEKPLTREMPTYLDLMLIQVKGRRHPQVKLVSPQPHSVNCGDDFLLITPQEMFHYKGEFANVIERAVCSEILTYIVQTKDMGVNQDCRVAEINSNSATKAHASFWKHLGGNSSSKPAGAGYPDDDDLYEAAVVSSNKVYEVVDNSLVPVTEAWGQSPKYQLLASDKVLVFDFGSEVYLWAGKFACPEVRKNGASLLKELWQEEFDYSDCDINPVSMKLKDESATMKGARPEWGICGKITENVETILFKEKFVDWPDTAQKSRRKEAEKELMNKPEPVSELVPCDVSEMISSEAPSPDLVLEMSHLGRGTEFYDDEERRLLCISTNDVKVWKISENEKNFMDDRSFGHFFAGETYVVRWYYNVTATGRTLKGTPSKHNMTGRTRVAYFFWQGTGSSVSDKGVSALMTVELDEERGPHIRVPMGSEPPAFLNLFNGGLVYHSGKASNVARSPYCMFLVRGNRENEAHLVEIELSARHLRSKGCLVVADVKNGIVYLWVGSRTLRHVRRIASHAANRLSQSAAPEMRWRRVPATLSEQDEGKESTSFLQLFDNLPLSSVYYSTLNRPSTTGDVTPRLWKFDPTRGPLEAVEVLSTYRCSVVTPFPIMQEELYAAIQPGLFLIDSGDKVWIWQGWWPDNQSDSSRAATGSAKLRFTFERRAVFQTALSYAQEKSRRSVAKEGVNLDPQLVVAGMEPLEFSNLFPLWEENPEIKELQEKEGRYTFRSQYSVRETLKELLKTRYSLKELVCHPRPDGIDQLHLEKYLSDEDFATAIGMDREAFYSLSDWKQVDIKKKANLF